MKRKNNDLFAEGRPVYLQLYERLRDEIISGVFPLNSRFPSKRVIIDRYGVSPVTAEHAFSLLCDEGYLDAHERSGYFVSFRHEDSFSHETKAAKLYECEQGTSKTVHSTAVDVAPFSGTAFPFSAYAKTMRKVISDRAETLLVRVPGFGLPLLREALSDYLARSRGIHVSPEQIIIGAGSEYLYGLLVQFFGRDKVFGIENPSYSKIEKVYATNGITLQLLTLGSDGITTEALGSCSADVIHISPYRSFPSGITTSASKRREYLRWADTHGAYIIEDDFESEFTPSSKPEETVFALSDGDNVLYLNSFTRTIAPSIRISYLLLPQTLVAPFTERLGFYSCTVSAFEQYVLAEFIASGEFERHLNRVRRRIRKK